MFILKEDQKTISTKILKTKVLHYTKRLYQVINVLKTSSEVLNKLCLNLNNFQLTDHSIKIALIIEENSISKHNKYSTIC